MPETPTLPREGVLATVRNRRALITRVKPCKRQHERDGITYLVDVEYTDLDGGKPSETLVWNREVGAQLLEPSALPRVHLDTPVPVDGAARGRAVGAEDRRMSELEQTWWASLDHGGMLIAPARLPEFFAESPAPLDPSKAASLRRHVQMMAAGTGELDDFLDLVLEGLLDLDRASWLATDTIDASWSRRALTGETIKPRRVWHGPRGEVLPLFTPEHSEGARLGVGRGRRSVARVIAWLRLTEREIAILTNGRQWRLIHAGAHYDAFCEWDIELWFEAGEPGPQVEALRRLLGRSALTIRGTGDERPPLIRAILASRKGQGDLSTLLGERMRQAVETLLQASSSVLDDLVGDQPHQLAPNHVYIAATRVIMRLVVVLFVEARELLPIQNPIYHGAYGLQGLREELERSAGGRVERLRHRFAAWPRLLGLFQLIYHGCGHEDLSIIRHGGGLFRTGEQHGDPVSRALHALEHPRNHVSDATVHRLLDLLTRCKLRVRHGKSSVWVDTAVDFSNLSSEYIGVLYEGLLDYELRRAEVDDPIVFLDIGNQPALPFSRLDALTVAQLEHLFETLAKASKSSEGEDLGGDAGEDSHDDAPSEASIEAEPRDGGTQAWLEKVDSWARKTVRDIGLVERGTALDAPAVIAKAKQLVCRTVLPGEWFLVRWGGTRKGAGTFYTPPMLAAPTVRRTLQPLTHAQQQPSLPEAILALKVCDPAMGSGSFLISALHWLTDALYESLIVHGRITRRGDGSVACLAAGAADDSPWVERLRLPPEHEDFEDQLRARLRRHIVDRCIHGVDIDPVAVELARLALWVETMDEALPFEFLDHRIKCGNALVGCWLDRFESYPIAAWEREAGDKHHSNFVHHAREIVDERAKTERKGDVWTHAIKQRKAAIKRALVELIETRARPASPATGDAALPGDLALLRERFDAWCALWFWPGDAIDEAPTPQTLTNPSPAAREWIAKLQAQHGFFHWELEFPDVFTGTKAGFDAIVGNPPWDIQKPNSKEFFSNIDPLYRGLGKQDALRWQAQAFADDVTLERRWIAYQAHFKALSNWVSRVADPFGDPERDPTGKGYPLARKHNLELHRSWQTMRSARLGLADPRHPFLHQGSADLNSYKLFVELGHALLREHGRMGMVVPSGLYTDKGTRALRGLLLDHCRWEWLFGFENRDKVFNIDGRFKFAALVAEKSSKTGDLRAAFMRRDLADWTVGQPQVLSYPRERISQFSPKSEALLELSAERDLAVLQKLYDDGVLLGDSAAGWGIEYAREFDMTNDSKCFAPRPKWESKGYVPDEYGHWLAGGWKPHRGPQSLLARKHGLVLSRDRQRALSVQDIEDVALPLYEGRMIGQFDFSEKGWVRGKGRSAEWRDIPISAKRIEPQYLMPRSTAHPAVGPKVAFMAIGSATNRRSLICSFIADLPIGNSLGTLRPQGATRHALARTLALTAILNSFVFDWMLRARLGGLNINSFILSETVLPRNISGAAMQHLVGFAAGLCMNAERFARSTLCLRPMFQHLPWRRTWASTRHERVRVLAMLDAIMAALYGLSTEEFAWVLRDCDWTEIPTGLDPKGFWRTDKDQPPELRHTVLAQVAFQELQRDGLDHFLAQNDGEGWMLPETLRLADYELGHDARAQQRQGVASVLGPRFHAWQLAQSVDESWEECERHAELLDHILPLFDPAAADEVHRSVDTS